MSGQPLRGPGQNPLQSESRKVAFLLRTHQPDSTGQKERHPVEGASCKREVAVDASLLGDAPCDVLAAPQLRGS